MRLLTPQEQVQAAVEGRRSRGFEDEILALEGEVPELGGIYAGPDGNPRIYLTDLSKAEFAKAHLARRAALMNVPRDFQHRLADPRNVEVLQGRFTFSQLVSWKQQITASSQGLGILAIDANEARNQIQISLQNRFPEEPLLDHLGTLSIPRDAVWITHLNRSVPTSSVRDTIRPTAGGLQIVSGTGTGWCTLGFNVEVQFYGQKGFLTAGHCNYNYKRGGNTGAQVFQPRSGTSNLIGTVSINPSWDLTSSDCLTGSNYCTYADAMYVDAADSSSSAWALRIAKPSSVGNTNTNGSINIIGYYSNVDIVPYIFVGATVYKFGRTTGGTVGGVTNTCEDTMVDPYGDPYTVICAVRVETAGIGTGDSGGPVYYPEFQSDPTYAIGIVFEMDGTSFSSPNLSDGGSYYCTANCKYWFSAMDRIQSHLNRYFSF